MGVSKNRGTPISHPKMSIFSRENPMGLLGKPTILGNPHITQTNKRLTVNESPQTFPKPVPLRIGKADEEAMDLLIKTNNESDSLRNLGESKWQLWL